MKLVIITRSMLGGGAERMVCNFLPQFMNAGVESTLIIYDSAKSDYYIPEEVNVYSVGDNGEHPVRRYLAINRLIRSIKPDVVLAMSEDVGTYTLAFNYFSSVPIIVFEANDPARMPRKKSTRFLRKLFYPTASGLVFQSKGASEYFPARIRKKGIILPNPLDCSKLPDPYEGVREKTVVTAGRLEEQKNHFLLIDAFEKFSAAHPDYKLIVYGDGVLRQELEEYAAQHLADNSYEFPGRTDTLFEKINSAGMFVLSSDYEGVPNVLIEAIALGLPCASTDCPPGGCSQLITDGVNGLLSPVGDADALSRSMCRIAEDEELARSLGSHYQQMRDIHETGAVCVRWLEFLRSRAKKR